jgi:hypothetical protein
VVRRSTKAPRHPLFTRALAGEAAHPRDRARRARSSDHTRPSWRRGLVRVGEGPGERPQGSGHFPPEELRSGLPHARQARQEVPQLAEASVVDGRFAGEGTEGQLDLGHRSPKGGPLEQGRVATEGVIALELLEGQVVVHYLNHRRPVREVRQLRQRMAVMRSELGLAGSFLGEAGGFDATPGLGFRSGLAWVILAPPWTGFDAGRGQSTASRPSAMNSLLWPWYSAAAPK